MKVPKLLVIWVVCLLGLGKLGEAQGEAAPFLYYYSDALRSFVIERADGTGSRALSQVVMPEHTTDIRIQGWSPSGEWLAWTSKTTLLGGARRNSAWAVNIDGVQSLEVLSAVGNVHEMLWSPTEDVLFVSDWEQTTAGFSLQAVSTHKFFLIDAQTQTAITTFEIETSFANLSLAAWTQDGKYVIFAYTISTGDGSQSFVRRISRIGEVEDIPIPHPLESSIHVSTPYPLDNWLLTRSEDSSQLIAVNAVSGESIEFDVPAPIDYVFLYQWNYTRDHTLIYVQTPRSSEKFELWLLSIPNQTLLSVATNTGNYANERETWIPWSPYTNHAVFYTDDGLYGLELEPQTHVFQILRTNEVWFHEWYSRGARVYFAANVLTDAGNPQVGYSVYDFEAATLIERDKRFSPYRISGDERFALVEDPLAVVDRIQEQVFPIQSDSRVQSFMYLLESVYWNRNGSWFITGETNIGGDGSRYLYMSVNNIDGTVHRELGSCYGYCASWLPEHVLAHVESE